LCYLSKFAADGVIWFSVFAGAASGDKLTAAISAGSLENEKITMKRKDGIAEPIKVKKPTAKPKIAAGMD
jgi:hypothetical protein